LKQTRRIWALLPHDYHESTKRYPVLYLQDAQNLFNESAPFGNWAIDKQMARLAAHGMGDLIIIAVDHGGKERISEYSPYYHRKFGKGKGIKYAKFIIDTLKPYVDLNFRTLTDRDHNGIGGSSMGGLISAYIGLVHAEYFSKMMIFSPSFWYSDEIYFDAFNYAYTHPSKVFLYGGEKESEYMSKHIHQFRDAIKQHPKKELYNQWKIVINPEGHHTESDWRKAFPQAIKWLFFNNN
jgi:predicted alpha/beta superfamily hydrolase